MDPEATRRLGENMSWLVIRFDFDEADMQFRKAGCIEIDSDEKLIKFIEEVMAKSGVKHLWQITKTKEGKT